MSRQKEPTTYQVRGKKIYVDANPNTMAYVVDGGPSNFQDIPKQLKATAPQAEYLVILFMLHDVIKAYDTTRKEFGPMEILSDSQVTVEQLNRNYHISSPIIRDYAQQIWGAIEHMDVKFTWVPRAENLAGKMLK